jgi:hypothetical protein
VYEPHVLIENITNQMKNALTLESLKDYHKSIEKIKNDRPKLFGLIMQDLSAESKVEIRDFYHNEEWIVDNDPEKLW